MDNEGGEIILLFGNDASCNPQDELGRTPFHDLAMKQGESPEFDAELASGAEQMISIFLNPEAGIKFSILDQDKKDNTALDLALKINPEVDAVKKVFIKYTLLAYPNLAKPASLTPELSAYWDECVRKLQFIKLSLKQNPNQAQPTILDKAENKAWLAHGEKFQKEDSAPRKTNNNSTAFFPTSTSANSDTCVENSAQAKLRPN